MYSVFADSDHGSRFLLGSIFQEDFSLYRVRWMSYLSLCMSQISLLMLLMNDPFMRSKSNDHLTSR